MTDDPRIAAAAAWLQSDDTAYEAQPDAAVRAAREMLAAADAVAQPRFAHRRAKETLYCSFCGKSQDEVLKLIAGPSVFICDECVELCMYLNHEHALPVNGEAEYRSWSK